MPPCQWGLLPNVGLHQERTKSAGSCGSWQSAHLQRWRDELLWNWIEMILLPTAPATVTCNMMHILHLLSPRLRVNRCKDSPCRCLALFKHNINPSGLWKSGSTNLASLSRWRTGPHEYGNAANKSLLHIVAKLIPHVCVRFLWDFFLHTFLPAVGLHASGAYWPVFRLWGEGGGHRWYMVIRSTHVRGIPSFF